MKDLIITILLIIGIILGILIFIGALLGLAGLLWWGVGSFVVWAFKLSVVWTFWNGLAVALVMYMLGGLFKITVKKGD